MFIRFLAVLCLVAAVSLSTSPAVAASYTFTTTLSGANEDPPNASPATGFARIVLDTIANTLEIHAVFAGLVTPTTVAHIHAPTAFPFSGNVGVAVQPPTLAGFPAGVTKGTYLWTFDTSDPSTYANSFLTNSGGGDALGAEAALMNSLFGGRAYLNIHTQGYPAGEIRGFFVPIPLPAGLPLLLAALGGLALLRRRAN